MQIISSIYDNRGRSKKSIFDFKTSSLDLGYYIFLRRLFSCNIPDTFLFVRIEGLVLGIELMNFVLIKKLMYFRKYSGKFGNLGEHFWVIQRVNNADGLINMIDSLNDLFGYFSDSKDFNILDFSL